MPVAADGADPELGPEYYRIIAGRYATVVVFVGPEAPAVQYVEHEFFDEVVLGSDSSIVELNSVLLLPRLMSDAECAAVIGEIEAKSADRGAATTELSYERFHIPELSSSTRLTFEAILRARLLPFVSTQLPHVESFIWRKSHVDPKVFGDCSRNLSDLAFRFSSHEPAINRYSVGCHFPPHTDNLALTVNVLLDQPGSFVGGGTNFWHEGAPLEHGHQGSATLRIEPSSGVGVVFNGNVKHSGGAVTAGVRHVLVASFSLSSGAKGGGPRRSLRGDLWPLIPTFVSAGGAVGMPAVCADTLLERADAHEHCARHARGLRAGLSFSRETSDCSIPAPLSAAAVNRLH